VDERRLDSSVSQMRVGQAVCPTCVIPVGRGLIKSVPRLGLPWISSWLFINHPSEPVFETSPGYVMVPYLKK
jgi:hypothetical protein